MRLAHLARQKAMSQLRTRSEGLQTSFTKPRAKARRKKFGGSVIVCAGISDCRAALWGRFNSWNGQVAAGMKKGLAAKASVKHRGRKAPHLVADGQRPLRVQERQGHRGENAPSHLDRWVASLLARPGAPWALVCAPASTTAFHACASARHLLVHA